MRSLEAAAERGIRHGNLYPAKVMLSDSHEAGRPLVKVLDFGVVDWFHSLGRSRREFRGTPGFASPEQAAGRERDLRADYYSLGATLYFLLSGTTPEAVTFPADVADPKAARRVHFTPLRERGVPPDVIVWLRRLLDPNPAGRPRDGFELVESLAALHARMKKSALAPVSPARLETTRWWSRWFGSPRR